MTEIKPVTLLSVAVLAIPALIAIAATVAVACLVRKPKKDQEDPKSA